MHSQTTQRSLWVLGIAAVLLAQAGAVHATGAAPVPEINPSSLSAGLAVLTGAVLILRSWRR
jgi:hypothetical protein